MTRSSAVRRNLNARRVAALVLPVVVARAVLRSGPFQEDDARRYVSPSVPVEWQEANWALVAELLNVTALKVNHGLRIA